MVQAKARLISWYVEGKEQSYPVKEGGEFWGEHVNFERKIGVNICTLYPNYGVMKISLDDGRDKIVTKYLIYKYM